MIDWDNEDAKVRYFRRRLNVHTWSWDHVVKAVYLLSYMVCKYYVDCIIPYRRLFILFILTQAGQKYMVVDEKPVRDDSFLTASARDLCKHKTIFWAHPGCLDTGMSYYMTPRIAVQ